MKIQHNILNLIHDANYLIEGERYTAALNQVLIAIDASSCKVFPPGTISVKSPTKKNKKGEVVPNEMGSKERYTRFLGVRLRQIFGFDPYDYDFFGKVFIEAMKGVEDPALKIYEECRCFALHEGGVPDGVKYVLGEEGISSQFCFTVSGGYFRFTKGFLNLLSEVVSGSVSNGKEFGRQHFSLSFTGALTSECFDKSLANKYGISWPRLMVMKDAIYFCGPLPDDSNSEKIRECLNNSIKNKLNGGARVGIRNADFVNPLLDGNDNLTQHGLDIFKGLLSSYKVIDVSY